MIAPAFPHASLHCQIDHLVVVAHSLEQGALWCQQTLGVAPEPGGRHSLMATHNCLLKIGNDCWPDAYLEIIAIDRLADEPPAAGRKRWFGIDEPTLREQVKSAPRLVHFVAQSSDLGAACANLAELGEDVGHAIAASRPTAQGELRWQITLRDDGRPQYGGGLPALIEWQGPHPAATMAESGIRLRSVKVRSDKAAALQRAWSAIGLESVDLCATASENQLEAILSTPLGDVSLLGGFSAVGSVD